MTTPNTRDKILFTAVKLYTEKGLRNVLRRDIAKRVGCATGLITWHFKSMDMLRAAAMQHAVDNGVHGLIMQGLAERHPIALKAPVAVKNAALKASMS